MTASNAAFPRLLHNPKCSKSRAALQLLSERGVPFVVVDYQATPLDRAALVTLLDKLQLPPRAVLRAGDDAAKALGIGPDDVRTDDEWLGLLVAHPRLLERPILETQTGAAVGRPPENLLALLER